MPERDNQTASPCQRSSLCRISAKAAAGPLDGIQDRVCLGPLRHLPPHRQSHCWRDPHTGKRLPAAEPIPAALALPNALSRGIYDHFLHAARLRIFLTVMLAHFPPRLVGAPSALSWSAIRPKEAPSSRRQQWFGAVSLACTFVQGNVTEGGVPGTEA
jgi:hypothetical protein